MRNNRWLNTVGRQGIQRLRQKGRLVWLASSITLAACAEVPTESEQHESQTSAALTISKLHDDQPVLETQLIAKRIPGAGAVTEIGLFLPGGAVHDTFARYTAEGAVFAPGRVLVASTSNFGARLANPAAAPGSILSIDPDGAPLLVPAQFAADGTQASAEAGRIQLFSGQSPRFSHPINTPATDTLTGVALPTGISLNNGSGRPWFSNAPNGAAGDGTVTVLNPDGVPTAIFAGSVTNHSTQTSHGLTSGALGTALLTKSPDETGKPVFAAIEADGSVVQVHVSKGVDGLAPAGTVTPVDRVTRESAESNDPREIARLGMLVNWVPSMNVLIADARGNRIVVLDVANDGALFFTNAVHALESRAFNVPIDLAPAVREIGASRFASNTMLAGGSDVFVLNRGDNTIVRMALNGKIQARRRIVAPVPDFRAAGLGVSRNGETLYITGSEASGQGCLLRAPSFGENPTTAQLVANARSAGANSVEDVGRALFSTQLTPAQGLGPLFNARACADCHSDPFPGGMGTSPNTAETLVGESRHGQFDDLIGHGGPVARTHSVAELGVSCALRSGPPARANAISKRSAMTLRGNSGIDSIMDRDILLNQAAEPSELRGHPNFLSDGRIGRFGWKANIPTLVEFMGLAFRNELGLTNPLQPQDEVRGCGAQRESPEVDARPLMSLVSFMDSLTPAGPGAECLVSTGAEVFASTGCSSCHTPTLPARSGLLHLYSDLLLHDMGPGLADFFPQEGASGSEWRTMPLWRVSERSRFLHDARTASVEAAILEHGGQAAGARAAFERLNASDRQSLLEFLACL